MMCVSTLAAQQTYKIGFFIAKIKWTWNIWIWIQINLSCHAYLSSTFAICLIGTRMGWEREREKLADDIHERQKKGGSSDMKEIETTSGGRDERWKKSEEKSLKIKFIYFLNILQLSSFCSNIAFLMEVLLFII